MIINIGSKLDLIQAHIATLGLSFPVYAGKPVDDPNTTYAYFNMVSNSERQGADSVWVLTKMAEFDFVFVGRKETPDVELYERVDEFSNAFCLLVPWSRLDITGFRITSIQESSQSGVIRANPENQKPFIIAGYSISYNYLYS